MLPTHLLWPFLLATIIFAGIPGPAVLYSAAQALAHGRRSAFMTVLGIHVGGYAYVAATALGLSGLMHYVPAAYLGVKFAGAAYLIWLGIGVISQKPSTAKTGTARAVRRPFYAFRDGVAVEVLNPKTAVFLVAFLPQFVEPAGSVPVAVQLLLLGTFVNLAFSCADIISVLLASSLASKFKPLGWGQRIMRLASGTILIGLGTRLATSRS
jgi:threonine/homoserine/homoserine lactone efflux protein